MTVLGLDIGGANIKAATSDGRAVSIPFPLWKEPVRLLDELLALRDHFDDCPTAAATMTGELADCFATKAEGVAFIVRGVTEAWSDAPFPCRFWSTAGEFVTAEQAAATPLAVAAANWHALATRVASEFAIQRGLLIDIGSTTTDLIPLEHGRPSPQGMTDLARLASRELIYTGVRRTPLSAVAAVVPFRGETIRVASECFATTLDVHLLAGDVPDDENDVDTANGRPATTVAAYDRLARMLCADREEITREEVRALADDWADEQRRQIAEATRTVIARLSGPCETVIVSGSGVWLARRIVQSVPELAPATMVALDAAWGAGPAESACAAAVARLADAARPATASWEI